MCSESDNTIDGKSIRLPPPGEPAGEAWDMLMSLDRRRAPRVSVQLPATANTDYGDKTTGRVIEISRSGLRLEGDRSMLETLLPNFYRRDKHLPVSIQVFFDLPDYHRQPHPVAVKCNIAYTRRAKFDIFQMGMQFVEIEEGSEHLTQFLCSLGV